MEHFLWIKSYFGENFQESFFSAAKIANKYAESFGVVTPKNQWKCLRISENSLNFSEYSTTKKIGGDILTELQRFFTGFQRLTDSNLELWLSENWFKKFTYDFRRKRAR